MRYFVVLSAAATLLFAGCEKKQSEMSVDDIKGYATVIGQVYYSAGTDYKNNTFSELVSPVANMKVSVKITNASLAGKDDSEINGYTIFETTTDSRGNYEITIPASETGVDVSVKPDDFVGTRQVVTIENGSVKTVKEDVIFYANEEYLGNVKPGTIVPGNIFYGIKELATDYEFPETLDYRVMVYKNGYESDGSVTFEPMRGANIYLTVKYDNSTTRTYAMTSDSNGLAAFKIPSKTADASLTLTLRAEPYVGNFTYVNSSKERFSMKGYYVSYHGNGKFDDEDTYTARYNGRPGEYQSSSVVMIFVPYEVENDYDWNIDWYRYFN